MAKRVNVEMQEDLHAKVKARCAEEGITITEFLNRAAEDFVGPRPVKRAHMVTTPKSLIDEIDKDSNQLRLNIYG